MLLKARALSFLLALGFAIACGSDDEEPGGGGNKGGSGGTGASGGSGGTGASGGSGGNTDASSGGSGGVGATGGSGGSSAGAGGAAGTAGVAGAGGAAGAATGGTAGSSSGGTAGVAGSAGGTGGSAGNDAGPSGGSGGTDAGDAAPDVPIGPAPTVTSIVPNNGLANYSTPNVVISGTNLEAFAQVVVAGVNVTACNFSNVPTSITCTIPPKNSVARGDVVITNPDSQSGSLKDGFTFTGVLNETNQAGEADYCVLQFPTTANIMLGQATPLIYGRIFETGVTPAPGAASQVIAELGWGSPASSPTNNSAWRWVTATFNTQYGNDDEYQASFTPSTNGSFHFTYRFSLDDGFNYTYCDSTGAGSNPSLTFSPFELGTLLVTP
jgi:hypothetical protein